MLHDGAGLLVEFGPATVYFGGSQASPDVQKRKRPETRGTHSEHLQAMEFPREGSDTKNDWRQKDQSA